MVSGKKKTSPKQPHLKPPPPDALHHLCYLSVSQYYFDINSAELLFTSFDDIEEPLQLFMDKPDLQELYVELKKARTFIIDPPDQGSYDLAKKYLTDFHIFGPYGPSLGPIHFPPVCLLPVPKLYITYPGLFVTYHSPFAPGSNGPSRLHRTLPGKQAYHFFSVFSLVR